MIIYSTVRFVDQRLTQVECSLFIYLSLGKTTRFIRIGDKVKDKIDAQSSTQFQFYIERTLIIQLNFTANRQANFGKDK